MKVALAQIDCTPAAVEKNTEVLLGYIESAANQGCKLVCFPELSDLGYQPEKIADAACSWDGAPYQELCRSARQNNIAVFCGLSEKTDGALFNSIAAIGSDGELLARYRKTHLFKPSGEEQIFTAGDEISCFQFAGITWGLSICFDLRFPALYSAQAEAGVEVFVNCTAWLQRRAAHWQVLCRARAIENQCWFLGVNRVGRDGSLEFSGNSLVASPFGELLACAASDSQELLIAELRMDAIAGVCREVPMKGLARKDLKCPKEPSP